MKKNKHPLDPFICNRVEKITHGSSHYTEYLHGDMYRRLHLSCSIMQKLKDNKNSMIEFKKVSNPDLDTDYLEKLHEYYGIEFTKWCDVRYEDNLGSTFVPIPLRATVMYLGFTQINKKTITYMYRRYTANARHSIGFSIKGQSIPIHYLTDLSQYRKDVNTSYIRRFYNYFKDDMPFNIDPELQKILFQVL